MSMDNTHLTQDVAGRINVICSKALAEALGDMLSHSLPKDDRTCILTFLTDLSDLYNGMWDDYLACDVGFHDLQHVQDVTLAMGRLLDGYQREHRGTDVSFSADMVLAGLVTAMYHDVGYIRRRHEAEQINGGEYTPIHVRRSAYFLARYLQSVDMEHLVPVSSRIMHFTAYDLDPTLLKVSSAQERRLGNLLGTADLIAQMSDRNYLKKCRDGLYKEFEESGIAGKALAGVDADLLRYHSVEQLLESTPEFIKHAREIRLDGYFGGVYRYADIHFGGRNFYFEGIEANLQYLLQQIGSGDNWVQQL